MKQLRYARLLLILLCLLPACATPAATPMPTPMPTRSLPTATASPVFTATPSPTPQPTATARPTLTPTPTPSPTATTVSDADSRNLLEMFHVTETAVNGARLWQIGRWPEGFRSDGYCQDGPYRWLDSNHLLLYPIVERTIWFEDQLVGEVTLPVVAGLDDGAVWITDSPRTDLCHLPVWSEARQNLIEAQAGEVRLRDLDGRISQTYAGDQPLHLAPSGLRLLAGLTWIDLATGQTVPLDSPADALRILQPVWTADETRFFDCCFRWGDAQSGRYESRPGIADIYLSGIGVGPDYTGITSHWVLDDSAVLADTGLFLFQDGSSVATEDRPGLVLIPLIEPASQEYANLADGLELTRPADCGELVYAHVRPNSNMVWIDQPCLKAGYLFDIRDQIIKAYDRYRFISWSPTGEWGLLRRARRNRPLEVLNPETGQVTQVDPIFYTALPDEWGAGPLAWQGNTFALLAVDGLTLYLYDAATGAGRLVELPQPAVDLFWQPQGGGLALLLADESLAWLPDAMSLESDAPEPETITPPFAGLRAVRWSPDGRYLAFVSDAAVYVLAP